MYNLNDDTELDRLTREAAEGFEVSANSNWKNLQLELDKVLPVEKKRRFLFLWWLMPFLLIGGTVTYWQMTKDNLPTKETELILNKAPISNDKEQVSETTTQLKNLQKVEIDNSKKTDPNLIDADHISIHPKAKIVSEPRLKKDVSKFQLSINEKGISSSKSETILDDKEIKKEASNNTNSKNNAENPTKENPTLVPGSPTKITDNVPPIEEGIAKNNIEKTISETKVEKAETITNPIQENKPIDETIKISKNPVPQNQGKGWSFGFLVGADKSTVKYIFGYEPGYNIGLMVGYHLNNKWSLHTGAIYTQKNYKMAGEDFNPPKGNWTYNYKIESITGYCRMWEVPILFRYQISQSPKNRFYISSGLSSYFMTYENYSSFYYYNGQPYTKNNAYNSSDTHILSIAHFSGGFENRISKKLSLGIEPYAKIPISGVGYGDIQLSSFGINFSVQYRQPSKK